MAEQRVMPRACALQGPYKVSEPRAVGRVGGRFGGWAVGARGPSALSRAPVETRRRSGEVDRERVAPRHAIFARLLPSPLLAQLGCYPARCPSTNSPWSLVDPGERQAGTAGCAKPIGSPTRSGSLMSIVAAVLGLLATILGIRGDTWNKHGSGLRRLTGVGWCSLAVALCSFSLLLKNWR